MKKIPLLELLNGINSDKSVKENYASILCGEIIVNKEKIKDPTFKVPINSFIEQIKKKYVSRGGYKLEKALLYWQIEVEGKVFLDAGSSTGGFTDCLLQHGAKGVHAVDVGYNQLDYSLRNDKRVFVHERENIMKIDDIDPYPDMGVADLSFRSIKGAAGRIISLVKERKMIALIKPQFEIDKTDSHFNGIVNSTVILEKILNDVVAGLEEENVFLQDMIESPIAGKKGNREYLAYLSETKNLSETDIKQKISNLIKN